MSKLIRNEPTEPTEHANDETAAPTPLSNSAVVSHLKACQGLAEDSARTAFKTYMTALDDAFSKEMDDAKSNQEAAELAEVQRMFRANRAELERYYCGYMSEGFVKFKKKQLNTKIGNEQEEGKDALSLVDNEDLEETIAITSLTQRAESYFGEPLYALNQRFAVLNGGQQVTEASNPATPVQLCESLRKALKLLNLDSKTKTLAYKVYDQQLLELTRTIVEEVNRYLKGNGVLPHLKYSQPTGSAPAPYMADENESQEAPAESRAAQADPNLSPEQYQHSLMNAIKGLQSQLMSMPAGAAPEPPPTPGPNVVPVSETDLVQVLQILQQQNAGLGVSAAPGEPRPSTAPLDFCDVAAQLQAQLKDKAEGATVGTDNMQTITLVGMLFEYMLNDENLPDTIKTLLSYLHTPFLKVAFIDPGFFEQTEHPARMLLNTLAEAGARWVGNDGTSQYGIYEQIQDTVERLLNDFDSDVKVITQLLLDFRAYTKNITRRQELMEKRATEKAEGEEKLREVKMRVNEEVHARIEDKELPSAVLLFLLQPWSDYLSFALLRYGEDSDKWKEGLTLADDLLWGIGLKELVSERDRQTAMYESIGGDIERGFETIGFDQSKGRTLIETLLSLIDRAMQSEKSEPAPPPIRDELEKIAAEKAGTSTPHDDEPTAEEAHMVESLKMIEFGTWFEFKGGKRLKVAWYNSRTSHYMLVDQMGKREDMMSGLDMARHMLAGDAKIISGSSKPFFERALENIFHKLNEKAEATKSGVEDVAS